MSGSALESLDGSVDADVLAWMDAADAILADPTRTAPLWLRAAGLLYRSALEEVVEQYWKRRAPGVQVAPFRSQLTCLSVYADPELARTVGNVWGQLSDMAHHRSDLGPERQALVRAGEVVRMLVSRGIEGRRDG